MEEIKVAMWCVMKDPEKVLSVIKSLEEEWTGIKTFQQNASNSSGYHQVPSERGQGTRHTKTVKQECFMMGEWEKLFIDTILPDYVLSK